MTSQSSSQPGVGAIGYVVYFFYPLPIPLEGRIEIGCSEGQLITEVRFSSFSRHGLENTGGAILRYLSAASPSFKKEDSRKLWSLGSVDEEGE